jgi:L-2-hydroxyglutarate oxidase LhgO
MRGELFYAAIRSYWPGLPDASLSPDYSGVRAKITSKLDPAGDFRIDTEDQHGLEGLINLFGFESPGLTSSLAIAEDVGRCLQVA